MAADGDRIIFALDVEGSARALEWARLLKGEVGLFKVGLELFVSEGPGIVVALREAGARLFLDLKLHDIPQTVRQATAAAARLGVELITVHASGGAAMVEAALEGASRGAREVGLPSPVVLAVTVLTSLAEGDLGQIGFAGSPEETVMKLAALATRAGAQGLVCSAREVARLRAELGKKPLLVVPGIRPAGADTHDQNRTDTPSGAISHGASLLVIGRPIREAAHPVGRAREIALEIGSAKPAASWPT